MSAPFPKYPGETLESMAEIGEAFMDALPKDYSWLQSPSEVIADLQNEADAFRLSHDALLATTAKLRERNEALVSAIQRLLIEIGEGTAKGRAIDFISKRTIENIRTALSLRTPSVQK